MLLIKSKKDDIEFIVFCVFKNEGKSAVLDNLIEPIWRFEYSAIPIS